MISPIQYAANRQNSTHSTGPRTPAGKSKSNMNAVRHGLCGRIVVLPTEDMAEFKRFSQLMTESLAPAGTVEQELAQTIADSQWRINRILSIEDGMLGLGHFEDTDEFDTQDPAINSVMSQARAFREHSKSFVNLSIYEQRIHRTMEKAHKRLQELQTARKEEPNAEPQADRKAEIAEPIPFPDTGRMSDLSSNPAPSPPMPDPVSEPTSKETGFVYARPETNPETETPESREHARLVELAFAAIDEETIRFMKWDAERQKHAA